MRVERIGLVALCVLASVLAAGAATRETGHLLNVGSAETDETQAFAFKQAQFLFHLGFRRLAGDGWDAAQSQQAIAFVGDWRPKGWPVSLELGLCFSASTENDLLNGEEDGVFAETSVGVKRYFRRTVRP